MQNPAISDQSRHDSALARVERFLLQIEQRYTAARTSTAVNRSGYRFFRSTAFSHLHFSSYRWWAVHRCWRGVRHDFRLSDCLSPGTTAPPSPPTIAATRRTSVKASFVLGERLTLGARTSLCAISHETLRGVNMHMSRPYLCDPPVGIVCDVI